MVGKDLGGDLGQIPYFSGEEMGSRELEWSVQVNIATWSKIKDREHNPFKKCFHLYVMYLILTKLWKVG